MLGVCDVTRGEAQVFVRECTTVSPAALVLVAGSLCVEALPPWSYPCTIRTMPRRRRRRRRRVRRRRRAGRRGGGGARVRRLAQIPSPARRALATRVPAHSTRERVRREGATPRGDPRAGTCRGVGRGGDVIGARRRRRRRRRSRGRSARRWRVRPGDGDGRRASRGLAVSPGMRDGLRQQVELFPVRCAQGRRRRRRRRRGSSGVRGRGPRRRRPRGRTGSVRRPRSAPTARALGRRGRTRRGTWRRSRWRSRREAMNSKGYFGGFKGYPKGVLAAGGPRATRVGGGVRDICRASLQSTV